VSKIGVAFFDAQALERLSALRQHMSGAITRKPNRVFGTDTTKKPQILPLQNTVMPESQFVALEQAQEKRDDPRPQ
jgi:hypothetical protein